MEVIGVDDDGFFTTYESDNQVTLEHYSPENIRLWTTALRPTTPGGKPATFHSMQMIKGALYMISSSKKERETVVYAQEIKHNGNYSPDVIPLARGKFGKHIKIATAEDEAALIVVLSGDNRQEITSALLTSKLVPRWTMAFTSGGDMQDVLVHPDGTTYLLTKALPAAPATTSFYLYRLEAKSGKYEEVVLGHSDYRPYKAKLAAVPYRETVVTGYMIPSSSVASHNPEPIGTFYYRFNEKNLRKPVVAYTPFDQDFIITYKRLKPDNDRIQRLRNLQLDRVVPASSGGVILIGEVSFHLNKAGFSILHNHDIIITRLRGNGSMAYITSANKLQTSTKNDRRLHSYFATAIDNSLQIIYLHFEYANNAGISFSSGSQPASKTPVLINIEPDGTKHIHPIKDSSFGHAHDFQICPTSAYQMSEKQFIILGLGEGFYRYGRMSFN
ncbi:hypothetical protein ACFSRY_13570 [Pontibacter locisalis]|uniref:Uncharacterized protein n=1 Tax=Pontibacter locisalis TaxID=1719035 RepID=A0ABW5IPN1_9BACT